MFVSKFISCCFSVTISVNGDVHHQNNMATNTTISSTENGAEQEEERKMLQQPMSILHESKVFFILTISYLLSHL